MPKRRRKATKRRPKQKRKASKRKRTMKSKLVGFTKTGGKFRLVFRRGKGKPTLGSKKFGTKKTMLVAARKRL